MPVCSTFACDANARARCHLHGMQVSSHKAMALLEEHYEAVDDAAAEPHTHDGARRVPPASMSAQPRMFAARGEAEAAAFAAGQSLARARAAPLGQRALEEDGRSAAHLVRHGAQEMSWIPGAGGGRGRGRGSGGRGERSGRGGRGDSGGRGGRGGRGGSSATPEHKRRRMSFAK
jgi:hypothetical protein